ncbi:hypothetical protein Hanom_Chr09g00838841 [Helianthus anomalus]
MESVGVQIHHFCKGCYTLLLDPSFFDQNTYDIARLHFGNLACKTPQVPCPTFDIYSLYQPKRLDPGQKCKLIHEKALFLVNTCSLRVTYCLKRIIPGPSIS